MSITQKIFASIPRLLTERPLPAWSSISALPSKEGTAPSREHFLKKKLGLTMPDAELEEAIVEICQRMAKDRDKHRVTFYYLLAEKYGKLAAFSK